MNQEPECRKARRVFRERSSPYLRRNSAEYRDRNPGKKLDMTFVIFLIFFELPGISGARWVEVTPSGPSASAAGYSGGAGSTNREVGGTGRACHVARRKAPNAGSACRQ
jgi:hypothetical protein